MAEKYSADGKDGSVAVVQNEVKLQTLKRCMSSKSSTPPPHKSPRTNLASPTIQTTHAGDERSKTHEEETQPENGDGPSCSSGTTTERRKSWRRSTIARRSLPSLPNPHHVLCRSISTTLTQEERLEKLMEASMMLAIEKTQNALQSEPNSSMESFQKQVRLMQKDWGRLAKSIHSESMEHQLTVSSASNPSLQKHMENLQKAINRLQAENESWETLLSKHRKKAEELERKVEQGRVAGVPTDSSCMAQSSQYSFIQRKPDYLILLCRQRNMLNLIMDTQCKMVRGLMSIKNQSQLVVKEISGRLVAKAGFHELSSEPIKSLMTTLLSSAASKS